MRHIQILRSIELIAKLGSIRKAADKLHIVSSALTRQVQDIERELGTPVFERKARGVRLTAAGELFVRYCRSTAHELELVRSRIEDLSGLRGGTVTVSAIEAAASTILAQEIVVFRKKNPRVAFEVRIAGADAVVASVVNDEAAIGLTFNPTPHVDFKPLAEVPQELHALMASDHPLARSMNARGSLRLRDCQPYPMLLGDASLGGRILLDHFLARSSMKLQPVVVSNSVEMMKTMARLSDAICFQVAAGVEAGGAAGGAAGRAAGGSSGREPGLKAVPLADAGLRGGKLILGVRRGRVLPVAAAVFSEQLRKRLQDVG